tara:strand:- start:788 stop:1666 length:879 start_codon:yes stop_codon:yes gene_type:complete
MNFKLPSKIKELKLNINNSNNIKLFIKREDLIHDIVSGNKWRKLNYNFKYIKEKKIKKILSFGGAYSNHLHALSWLAKKNNIKSFGLVRGCKLSIENPTLSFCKKNKMDLFFLDRSTYRNSKYNNPIFKKIIKSEENVFVIPEGGFNEFGIKGCEEIMDEVNEHYDIICCSIGSGCTSVGIIKSLKFDQSFLGFSSFKNNYQIKNIISEKVKTMNWEINSEYNFGGFGQVNDELKKFIKDFKNTYAIMLDPIYTSKLFFGLFDMISKNKLPKDSRILVLHTGGLQGLQGVNL